jgi:hypothetical protein
MIKLGCSILQAGPDVRLFQKLKVDKDLRMTCPSREHVEHVLHAQAVVADAGASAATIRMEGYALSSFLI